MKGVISLIKTRVFIKISVANLNYIWHTSVFTSVRPAQISILTNPNRRCDHSPTTMGESSGSQGDPLLPLSVGTWDWSATVGYLGPPEVHFWESCQISHLASKRAILTKKILPYSRSVDDSRVPRVTSQ